jgi:hypothetical protein
MARAIARAAMNAASLPAPLNLPAWRDYVKQS